MNRTWVISGSSALNVKYIVADQHSLKHYNSKNIAKVIIKFKYNKNK